MKTKRSLLTSCLSLLLCFAMLLGTTFAWFTDVATSSGNVIKTGNLDIVLKKGALNENGEWTWTENQGEAIFDYDKWEPGYTTFAALAVENVGSLDARITAKIVLNGTPTILGEVIDVYTYVGGFDNYDPSVRPDFSDGNWQTLGTIADLVNGTGTVLPARFLNHGQRARMIVALHMREDAGNEYQNMDLGANFDIKVLATQATSESDSFDDQYDADAEWPETNEGFETTASLNQVQTTYGALANDFIIRYSDSVYALLPAGTKLAAGVDSLKFSGKQVANGSNITLGDGDSAKSYDIHIEGIAEDNTQPITVYLGPILDKNISDTSLKLYHEDTLMTRVDSVDAFASNNQYTYDPATGDLVIYVDNFSVFSSILTYADKWDGTAANGFEKGTGTESDPFVIETAAQFAYFRNQVDAGVTFDDQFVKLGVDIDLTNIPFDPIGFGYYDNDDSDGKTNYRVFMGSFDGGNHTIYNLYENCWELDPDKTNYSTYTYSTAGAGLFASIKDATIKNLAISGAEVVFECVDMGVLVGYAQGTCHFENIVVTDANIANYNRYTGGLVGEVSYGPYGTDTELGYSHTFKNITVDSTVKVSGLWGSFGCGMGGVIGGKWGDATVKMGNVVSAAEMDVYNDVVSAYQWYAFRGCGMLIGHTEEPYSDGRHSGNATASFLTCENVKVYYGDWVNYHYYEFENQDNATGQRYPWVRAEAGEYCDAFSNIRYGVPTHGGVKVSDLTEEELKAIATDYTPIVFDQLYGADRGMYGTANHDGVTVFKKNVKTVYIHNNASWTNLKLDYWYRNGDDTWTNLLESVVLTSVEDGSVIYKIEVPAYVDSFKITSSESAEGETFELSKLADGEHIDLEGNHIHAFVNQKCVCGAVIFEFGANQDISHSDGWGTGEYTETVGEYTLTLTDMAAVYKSANDALGNSCLKLGTNSVNATFTFTVPGNATEAIIYVAKYKDNDSTVTVNNKTYELTKNSDNGEYDEIIIDTTEVKTITLTTVADAQRCMVNSIVFVVEKLDHEHSYESVVTAPTCTEDGYTTYTCSICSHSYIEAGEKKTGHSYGEGVVTTEATCTTAGVMTYTCKTCSEIKTETVEALGHNYIDGVCSVCGDELEHKDIWQLVTDASTLQAGDKIVIVAKDYNYALSTTQNSNNRGQATVTKVDDTITFGDDVQIITLEVGTTSGTYAFNTGSGYLYAASSGSNHLKTQTTNNENGSWEIEIDSNGIATIKAQGTNTRNWLRYNNQSSLFSCYASGQADIVIYKLVSDPSEPDTPACEHTNTTEKTEAPTCTEAGYTVTSCVDCGEEISRVEGAPATGHLNTTTTTVDATCTEAGSITVTCDDCGATVSSTETAALGHNYVDGVCNREDCGAKEPSLSDVTISFASTAQRESQNTSKQVWKNDGVTLTNNKASSTSNVANYSNPVRFYANSEIVVAASGITKIVFDCNSGSYATALKNSIGTANGATVTVSSDKVTVTFTSAVDSFTIANLTAQVRMDSITVTYTK